MIDRIDKIVDAIGGAVAWLNLGMVGITCVVVTLRYAFEIGTIFLQESVVYLHGTAFLIGLSYALQHDAHVRVDIIYSRLSERTQALVNGLGHTLLLMPLCVAIVLFSWDYTISAWVVLEGSSEVAGVPAVFLLKTLIPVSASLLFLQAGALGWRELRILRG
ncbi:MAG: TRAP transporter small permease subunit [Gammaproteobacteria bacterium]|nr:TRAP transporter small permease subunit [Gammaproteobacteria bacterium]